MKFSANTSRTASKPRLTCPSTVCDVTATMIPPRSPHGGLQNCRSCSVLVCWQRAIGRHQRVRWRRLRAALDAKQLFSLHDEVHPRAYRRGQPPWQCVEVITGALTCPHDQTTGAARHFIEDERPSHHEGVVRTPAEYEVALPFERHERETVRDSRKRREDHPARQMLKVWDDAFLTSLSAVIKHVVAAVSYTHLTLPTSDLV